jgi:hypothetical protein
MMARPSKIWPAWNSAANGRKKQLAIHAVASIVTWSPAACVHCFIRVASGRDTIAGVMHQHLAAGLADQRSVSLHSYRDAVTKD